MRIYSQRFILDFISKLIHPRKKIDFILPSDPVFWENLVKIGSSHLILPVIYKSLCRKKLNKYIPNDLNLYLNEILNLNYNRNVEIIKQISFISKIFNKNHIDHVFLKGSALLLTNTFDAIKERMVGDIDILICESHLDKAFKILLDSGFRENSKEFEFSMGLLPQEKRHLKRIIHPDYLAAVELHRFLVHNPIKNLLDNDYIFNNKFQTTQGYYIPSKDVLWRHAILNWQLNDNGIYLDFLHFRSIIDVIYLEPQNVSSIIVNSPKPIKHFYSLLSLHYKEYDTHYPLNKGFYFLQLKYNSIRKIVKIKTKI